MSADLLRQAATLMHERAQAATSDVCPDWISAAVRHVARNCDIECYHPDPQPHDHGASTWDRYDDAEHIASWHPAVALAVADWLEHEADVEEQCAPASTLAVAVARAYLGRSS